MAKKKQQSLQSSPLVAIDLGSDAVRAMAAECTESGMLHILGVETSKKFPSVERGVVTNSSNAGYVISEVMKLLANRIKADNLPSAFVCVGGQTMQIVNVCSKRDQVRKREITQAMLDEMEAECKQKIEKKNIDVAVLDLIPTYFVLDGHEQDEIPAPPQCATVVEAHYAAFVGRKELERNVAGSFERSSIFLENSYARPDALLSALATAEEMQQGCAVLDMGAQTTTLTIYKEDQYLCNKVIPQGGYDISCDIAARGMSIDYAEKLKCQYGIAMPELLTTHHTFKVPSATQPSGKVVLSEEELTNIIQSRLDRIFEPVREALETYKNHTQVLYITGGASMLQGMEEYVKAHTDVPVVLYGSHADNLTIDTPEEWYEPTYSALVGTLLLGAEYRKTHPTTIKKKSKFGEFKGSIKESVINFFTEEQTSY